MQLTPGAWRGFVCPVLPEVVAFAARRRTPADSPPSTPLRSADVERTRVGRNRTGWLLWDALYPPAALFDRVTAPFQFLFLRV